MGEQRQDGRPALKVLPGGGGGEARALQRLLGQPHAWLLKLGAALTVLAAGAFLLVPAFSRRAPTVSAEEVAAAVSASEGLAPVVTGLALVLDLDAAQAGALEQTLQRYDEAARAPRQAREAALLVLRGAASGTGAEAAAVDQALAQRREAQARLQALEADLVEALSAGLTPSQKARAAIVLGHDLRLGALAGPPRQRGSSPAPGGAAPDEVRRAAPATTAPAARP